jgi:uncharacterized membrane protein YbhN (UPF0104 family)
MTRRRVLQTVVLFVGLVGVAVAVVRTVDEAGEQVLPGPAALAGAAVLNLVATFASGRAWTVPFTRFLDDRGALLRLRGTFYLSQLTKYVPAGGVVQAASQVSMATASGIPLGQVALGFPVAAACTIVAGATLSAGLAFATSLPGWARAVAAMGLAAPLLLHRRLMEATLGAARRLIARIPAPDRLPSQREILAAYGWALIAVAAVAAAYVVLLGSIVDDLPLASTFFGFAASWVIGFLVVPIPAGVGVRELVLVAVLPGVETAPLLAASLALRLVAIGTEVLAVIANRLAGRRYSPPAPRPEPLAPATSRPSAHESSAPAPSDG